MEAKLLSTQRPSCVDPAIQPRLLSDVRHDSADVTRLAAANSLAPPVVRRRVLFTRRPGPALTTCHERTFGDSLLHRSEVADTPSFRDGAVLNRTRHTVTV